MTFASDDFSEFDNVELVGTLPAAGSWTGAIRKEPTWRSCTTAPERAGAYAVKLNDGGTGYCWFYPDVKKWAHLYSTQSDNKKYCELEQRHIRRCVHDGYNVLEWLDAPPAQVNVAAREVSSSIGSSTRNQAELSVAAAPSPGDIALQRKEWREWFGAYQSTQKFGERNE